MSVPLAMVVDRFCILQLGMFIIDLLTPVGGDIYVAANENSQRSILHIVDFGEFFDQKI